mgnify:CR=1 FL=1
MDQKNFSKPLSLAKVQVTDAFWKKEMELVRTEVIPYQWNALNDNVPGAAPSFCMRNYRRAGEVEKERKAKNIILKRDKFFGGDLCPSDCMKVIGISRGTYYKYRNDLQNTP